jgi:RNA polymerase sigma factor (sigma-70 family)
MNAVISGQSGVAVLVDSTRLASIHAGSDAAPVDRSPGEVRFLLGEARDLEFLEDIAPEEVRRRLEVSTSCYDALHLALILLDGELSRDTRRTAAEELDELLALEGIASFVESVLHAQPLPKGGDLLGGRSACSGGTQRALALVERFEALQTVIREVHGAWEKMADSHFGTAEDRQHALSLAVKEGLFRDLVAIREAGASVDSFLSIAVQNPSFQQIENSQHLLRDWVAEIQKHGEERSVLQFRVPYVAKASARLAAAQGRQGDVVARAEPSIDELLRSLRPQMKQILGRYRIPAHDAEDLLQESLFSTIQKWETLEDPAGWLLTTLRNRCVVYWRKRRNTLYNAVDTAILELLAEPVAAPQERAELLRDLSDLLEKLPLRCRTLLRLRYSLGYDSSEVAEKMGYHPSSVQKIARRCMAALTYQMVTHGFTRDDP